MKRLDTLVIHWTPVRFELFNAAKEAAAVRGGHCREIQVTHHRSWFERPRPARAWILNSIHLLLVFLKSLLALRQARRAIVFGTNAVRALAPFAPNRPILFVYNELPELDLGPRWLESLDRQVIKRACLVGVSTHERLDWLRRCVSDRNYLIVPNVPSGLPTKICPASRSQRMIYAGDVSRKRFPVEGLELLGSLPLDVIVIGRLLEPHIVADFPANVRYAGNVPHDEAMRLQGSCGFGLLTYFRDVPNYEYCAPIKLYEYLANGLICLSLFRNQGLTGIAAKYPELIKFADSPANLSAAWNKFDATAFVAQREAFFREQAGYIGACIKAIHD